MNTDNPKETAKCRGCGRQLDGNPYYMGGLAYDPITKKRVKANHYGGWVCSENCDVRACIELESTMPGCNTIRTMYQLSPYAKRTIKNNWL